MPLIKPTNQAAYWLIPVIDLSGTTAMGDATGINNSLTVLSGEGEVAFLAAAQGQASVVSYKPLPASGWLEAGQIYGYSGGLVIVRQSHNRTGNAPETAPALFSVYRAGGGVLDWVANEPVTVGALRIYGGKTYRCIQAHTTQTDWTPTATTGTLWAVYTISSAWAVGVAYKVGDQVTYNGSTYKCLQAHTSIATWTPSATPALWQKQ